MSVTFLFLVVTAKINQLVVYIAMLFKHFSLRWIFSLIFWNIFVRRNQENECFGHTYLHERASNLFQIATKQSNFSQSALIKLYIILFFLFWFQPQYSQNLTAFCNDVYVIPMTTYLESCWMFTICIFIFPPIQF